MTEKQLNDRIVHLSAKRRRHERDIAKIDKAIDGLVRELTWKNKYEQRGAEAVVHFPNYPAIKDV